MDSDYEAFVRAVIADPGNDLLRLVFADWLEERGDRRGEFIRVQVQLALIDDDHETPQFRDLHGRELAALEASKDQWFAIRKHFSSWDCQRGFLVRASLKSDAFLRIRDELFREHPVLRLSIGAVQNIAEIIDYPPLVRLTHLFLGQRRSLRDPVPQLSVVEARLLAGSVVARIPSVTLDARAQDEAATILHEAFGDRLTLSLDSDPRPGVIL